MNSKSVTKEIHPVERRSSRGTLRIRTQLRAGKSPQECMPDYRRRYQQCEDSYNITHDQGAYAQCLYAAQASYDDCLNS